MRRDVGSRSHPISNYLFTAYRQDAIWELTDMEKRLGIPHVGRRWGIQPYPCGFEMEEILTMKAGRWQFHRKALIRYHIERA